MPNIYRSTTLRNFCIMANFMKARACQNHKRARVIFPLMHWRPCACARPRFAPSFFPPSAYVGCVESLFGGHLQLEQRPSQIIVQTLFLLKLAKKSFLSFNISLHKLNIKGLRLFSVASYIVSYIFPTRVLQSCSHSLSCSCVIKIPAVVWLFNQRWLLKPPTSLY